MCFFQVHFFVSWESEIFSINNVGVLFVKQFMIINDEPSPAKRLRVGARKKMVLSSLHTIRSYRKKEILYGSVGVIALLVGIFSFTNAASSHEEKRVADEDLQRYNACVLSKDITAQDDKDQPFVFVDDECVQLSKEGKITENSQDLMAQEIATILKGSPMEEMAEYIAKQDQKVAGLIVGIAMIESQWGLHAPSKAGVDCYNYWGYKTTGSRGQSMGYACFGSREEAVNAVGERLAHFVHDTHRDTPAKMVYPWKCGGSCATHSPESVARWVGTVNTYYNQITALEDQRNTVTQTTYLSKK